MSDNDMIRRGDALAAVQGFEYGWHAEEVIAALPAVTVAVKPLVWEQISDRTIEAVGVGSTYRIQTMPDGGARWQSRYMGEWHNAPSVDAAKDAIDISHRAALSQFVTIAALKT